MTMDELTQINEEIKQLKRQMYQLSKQVDGFSHPDLVKISQQLDQKLNKQYRLTKSIHDPEKTVERYISIVFRLAYITIPYILCLPHYVLLSYVPCTAIINQNQRIY
ncbi:Spo0E family sporulation regulatory protein-aspartic acid phosphatase [Ammoniphilus sp. 3BR4]|uniref:Spo0E family sporulation regulatory protein-aspartic acid phosphatase n=1 Tax=Ammoniphilus sp. 3BR4 TaxID=3158265 RepID=UPI0034670282